jgi:hypothetical protein
LSDDKRDSILRSPDNVDDGLPDVEEIIDNRVEMPLTMRVMEDVLISSIIWLRQYPERVIRMGITHLVIPEELVTDQIKDKFDVFTIPKYVDDKYLH